MRLRDVTFSKKWHLATHPGAKGDFHERRTRTA